MVTAKSSAKPASPVGTATNRRQPAKAAAETDANPYAMSSAAAAKAVRRAGIVTPAGKLSRVYK